MIFDSDELVSAKDITSVLKAHSHTEKNLLKTVLKDLQMEKFLSMPMNMTLLIAPVGASNPYLLAFRQRKKFYSVNIGLKNEFLCVAISLFCLLCSLARKGW